VGPRAKIDEELRETDLALAAGDKAAAEAELGDLLFSVVNLARKVGVDAECALRGSVERFESRFAHVELRLAERGRTPRESTLTEMDELWNEAKAEAKRIEGARTDGGKHERDGEAKFP
jgi:uncharacterized protein YabN with tetrapyrrole methylase and pyrophosphatase domain